MSVVVRPFEERDVEPCGRIVYEAFRSIADRHGFPHDFPSAEVASSILAFLQATPGFYGVVAERDGVLLGSNFLDERHVIAGVGPITVDPQTQDRGVGRLLMEDVLNRSDRKGYAGVRLVQVAYHARSLSLYTKLGFASREELAVLSGVPESRGLEEYTVRPMEASDLPVCDRLCTSVYGFSRGAELQTALSGSNAFVAVRNGSVQGYTSGLGYFGHSIGQSTDDIRALLAFAPHMPSLGVIVPIRDYALLRWCLDSGMRMVLTMTLMSRGLYQNPEGPYLPSVVY